MSLPRKSSDAENAPTLASLLAGPTRYFTPLYVISGLIVLLDAVLVVGVTRTEGWVQGILTISVPVSLLVLIGGIFALLWGRPLHLYSPREFGQPATAAELADAFQRGRVTTESSGTIVVSSSTEVESEEHSVIEGKLTSIEVAELVTTTDGVTTEWKTTFYEQLLAESAELGRAEEAFAHVQEEESDPEKRRGNEQLYLYMRLTNGDTSALEKIESLAEESRNLSTEIAATSHFRLGIAYQQVSSHAKAEGAFRIVLELSEDEDRSAQSAVRLAASLQRLSRSDEAVKTLTRQISESKKSSALATLYVGLAELFDDQGNKELKALALEKALEQKPQNIGTRFDAAYAYGESGLGVVSLLHYQIVLQTSPQHLSALNNSGVHYQTMGMPTLAIESYKKAFELEETLAAANLAYAYLGSGFHDDAMRLLEEAQTKESPHQNVSQAIFDIAEKRKTDAETQNSLLKQAREQRVFLSSYADASFSLQAEMHGFAGSWHSDEGHVVSIANEDDKLLGEWETSSSKTTFEGTIKGRTVKISNITEKGLPGNYLYKSVADTGFAFISIDGSEVTIMGMKKYEPVFIRLRRLGAV